jgi:hypothetical protein
MDVLKEIYALTGKRLYLFVDRISIVRDELYTLLKDNKTGGIPLTVVCAERENEWLVYCDFLVSFLTQDFTVEYLVPEEVVSLIGSLERHHALGLLADRSPEERINAFAVRADRQLLVALHETTLGAPFEKIISMSTREFPRPRGASISTSVRCINLARPFAPVSFRACPESLSRDLARIFCPLCGKS